MLGSNELLTGDVVNCRQRQEVIFVKENVIFRFIKKADTGSAPFSRSLVAANGVPVGRITWEAHGNLVRVILVMSSQYGTRLGRLSNTQAQYERSDA